jgi:hypothetical protein
VTPGCDWARVASTDHAGGVATAKSGCSLCSRRTPVASTTRNARASASAPASTCAKKVPPPSGARSASPAFFREARSAAVGVRARRTITRDAVGVAFAARSTATGSTRSTPDATHAPGFFQSIDTPIAWPATIPSMTAAQPRAANLRPMRHILFSPIGARPEQTAPPQGPAQNAPACSDPVTHSARSGQHRTARDNVPETGVVWKEHAQIGRVYPSFGPRSVCDPQGHPAVNRARYAETSKKLKTPNGAARSAAGSRLA